MKLLSFDTSISSLSVAILEDEKLIEEVIIPPDENNRQEAVTKLMPSIDEILVRANWDKTDLTHICVGIGPGSFTGTRIGVVTARSISQGLNIPIIGINRFETIVEHLSTSAGIILDGGRNHVFVAAYRLENDLIQIDSPEIPPCDLSYDELLELLRQSSSDLKWYVQKSLIATSLFDEVRENSVLELPELERIASIQGKIAVRQLNSSNKASSNFPIDSVKPLYLRGASITLKSNATKSPTTKS